MYYIRYVTSLLVLLWAATSHAQDASKDTPRDTLRLTPQAAEARFITKNLTVLATKYNTDIAKALTDQTRLWDNPTLTVENNLFNFGGPPAPFMGLNQEFVQVQQLIRLAGKRKKLIELTAENENLAGYQLNDLLRHLRYQLRVDVTTLAQAEAKISLYRREQTTIQQLLNAVRTQVQQGNMAAKEQVRLEALQSGIRHNINDEQVVYLQAQGDLKILLRAGGDTIISIENPRAALKSAVVADLLNTALAERPDIAIAKSNLALQQKNLVYQQALKYPDLNVGINYDRGSNFTPHYTGVNVSLPLPIFNKNQGNIKAAEFGVKQQEALQNQIGEQIKTEVWATYSRYVQLQQLSNPEEKDFLARYATLMQNLTKSYAKREIGLVEFIDFYESYKDTQLQQLQTLFNIDQAREDVNFAVGKTML